jgi:hypothetical protein
VNGGHADTACDGDRRTTAVMYSGCGKVKPSREAEPNAASTNSVTIVAARHGAPFRRGRSFEPARSPGLICSIRALIAGCPTVGRAKAPRYLGGAFA